MGSQEDHDLLIEIRTDVRYVKAWTHDHEDNDDIRFKELRKDVELHKKILYGGMGIFAFVELISKFLK